MLSLLSLLSLMTVTPLRSFNIDTNKKWIFSLPDSPLVGHKVLQHSDGHRNWILVTSLLKGGRQPGRLYKCALVQDKIQCEDVLLGEKVLTLKNIQPDITLTASPEWILACVQQKRRQARSVTEELNGLCTRFTGHFQVEEAFVNLTHIIKTQLNNSDQNNNNNNNGENVIDTDKLIGADNVAGISCVSSSGSDRACRESATEVAAIVLDGSGSIESEDLISKVTTSTQVTFAVVQYGAEIQTELDLWESCNAPSVLHNTMQLDSVAKTASALLQHGLNEIFSESHGSVKDTHKMTDGGELHQDPLSLTDVMSPPEMEKGLGVGHIFSKQRALKELQLLALDLEENDLFKLPGYEALEGSIWATSAKILPNDELKYENHNANNNNNDYSALEDDEDDSWTEIAIVLDGSGSIEPDDFQRAKDFISTMMETFYKNCFECDFALVQYGTDIRTEFDLRDSRNAGVALQRLHNITQVRHETKTASAIQHVLDFIFSESNGSRKNAAKIIVVLTDGEMLLDNMDLTTVINSPKMAGIVRYAIGVGEAFNKTKAYKELQLIASDPDETHLFRVTNYSALSVLLSMLQQKIIGIEGTAGSRLEYEMAQMGFSAQILDKQRMLFGAVGAFDWSGGVLLYDPATRTAAFLNESKDNAAGANYSYLGYSVAVVKTRNGELYVAGAPRHNMLGKVLVFERDSLKQILQGEQIGSYFGSEICPLDIDRDGVTDYLLVGAPFYHIHGEEGKVYVYQFGEAENAPFTLSRNLTGQPPFGRFGFTVASIGDIDGDGYEDVAIGAPLEGHHSNPATSGTVYIYNSNKDGLQRTFSQRITAADIAQGLQYFGQSIAGGFDFTGDSLIEIAVGSLENVTVLRSRPVFRFNVTMSFTPGRILNFHNKSIITAELCFNRISPLETSQSGILNYKIHYTVDLDVKMEKKRVEFENQTNTISTEMSATEPSCPELRMQVLPCDYNCFSSVTLRVRYHISSTSEDVDHPAPMLNTYQEPEAYFQLPYKEDCGNKTVCVANLTLKFLSQKVLVVGYTKELLLNISLANSGDDSYLTRMVLKYPQNLQFKNIIPEPSSPIIDCGRPEAPKSSFSRMTCNVGHPIFRKTPAHFSVIWQLNEMRFPEKSAVITMNVTNINENSTAVTEAHELDVTYAFTAVLTRPTPLVYVNISQGLSQNRAFQFNLNSENRYGAEVKLQIYVPVSIQGHPVTTVKNVTGTQNTTRCRLREAEPVPGGSWGGDSPRGAGAQARYRVAECVITASRENVTVVAELHFADSQQFLTGRTELQVIGELAFDRALYVGLTEETHRAEITLVLLKGEAFSFLPVIIGSSVGGFLLLAFIIFILYKCGFFKRNYKNMLVEQQD